MPTRREKIHHTQLLNVLSAEQAQLDRFYARITRRLAALLKRHRLRNTADVWKGNKRLEREVEKLLSGVKSEYAIYLRRAMQRGVDLSDTHLDNIWQAYKTDDMRIRAEQEARILARETVAVSSWAAARVKGLVLSNRVWDISKQTKEQIEFYLKSGLAEGQSAAVLATDLKKYLKEPNRRFRRVRDPNTGKLKLSEPAKAYRPGRGVYRSSYRNALRMTRTEINTAYRFNDYQRRKNMKFIKGIRVHLSAAHPAYDICDDLVGPYPKEFVFTGWHPNCLCYSTAILASRDEFVTMLKTGKDVRNKVNRIPKRAQDYLNKNAERIKGWKSKPEFLQMNFKNTKDGFALKKTRQP